MARIGITDIMRESGLSRATVDRVLNGRGGVHQRTRDLVLRTLRRLSGPPELLSTGIGADLVLRLGRGMMAQMQTAFDTLAPSGSSIHDLYQADDAAMLERVSQLCEDASRPLVITAKHSDRLVAELSRARARGKVVITLVSDLSPDARDVFVGIDNRAAGQTAAFLIGRALGDRPTTVGVVLGDHAYRCHEDREIGFRTALRAHFPKVILAAEALGEDSPTVTRDAVRRMLKENPATGAIYNVGGGNAGMIEALRDLHRARELLVVGHETNSITVPFLQDGLIDFLIATDPGALFSEAMRHAALPLAARHKDLLLVDFGVYTRFSVPGFGRAGG